MVVLVALERQAEALDGIGDKADGLIRRRTLEGLDDSLKIVPAEIGHQLGQSLVIISTQDGQGDGMNGEVLLELSAPRRPALKNERGVEHVRTIVDPFLEALTTRLGKGA